MQSYTITKKDIGKSFLIMDCPCCKTREFVQLSGLIGRVAALDVGKKLRKTAGGVWQIENDEQLAQRSQRIINN